MLIQIYTDGGCSGNPGPGGWAYVMVLETFQGDSIVAEEWGGERDTTNNRMELLAVISALKAVKLQPELPRQLRVYTDSQYVQKGISEWIRKWKQNSWRTSDKKPVKNQDLWKELDALASEFPVTWAWVKGHAGNKYNERCDALTQRAIASL
ncbi:MAG: ribonuclease HI [Treponema sp.]|nr:ribonuclease HI [Treponema sp.]